MSGWSPHRYAGSAVRLRPRVALAETFPRMGSPAVATGTLTSGRLYLVAIDLPVGLSIASITFGSGTVAAASPLNQWFALYDQSRNLLRQTVDDGTTAWAAGALKTLALTSAYGTTYAGLHYLGIMVNATTVPNLVAVTGSALANSSTPVLSGPSSTGLTGTAPNPAAAIAGSGIMPWAYVA